MQSLTRSRRTPLVWRAGASDMAERYFSAVAMGGGLHVQGISDDQCAWESRQLVWFSEQQVKLISQPLAGDRKAKTRDELEQTVRASERGLPTIKLWVHESLEDAARKLWEESARCKKAATSS